MIKIVFKIWSTNRNVATTHIADVIVVADAVRRFQARDTCRNLNENGKLAQLDTSAKQRDVTDWLDSGSLLTSDVTRIWIGLHKNEWQWTDGT